MPREEQARVVLAPVEGTTVQAGEIAEAPVVRQRHRLRERLPQDGHVARQELLHAPAHLQGPYRRSAPDYHLDGHGATLAALALVGNRACRVGDEHASRNADGSAWG